MMMLPALLALMAADPARDAQGFVVHTLESKFQAKPTTLRVLVPDKLDKDKRYRVIYVLPVEAGTGSQFGDGLLEVKKLGLHNKLGAIFVQPTFSHLPWYGDHPSDAGKRQETYFIQDVLPFVEKTYTVQPGRPGRLLLGFSKSGCGAFSLLLRHPGLFEKAAAWDAPLAQDTPGFGGADIFGTPENFQNYRIDKLLHENGKKLGKGERLALTGHNNFGKHHQRIHELMRELDIPHGYRDERKDRHHWNAGWIEESVRFLTGE